jgi:hypothetical protein
VGSGLRLRTPRGRRPRGSTPHDRGRTATSSIRSAGHQACIGLSCLAGRDIAHRHPCMLWGGFEAGRAVAAPPDIVRAHDSLGSFCEALACWPGWRAWSSCHAAMRDDKDARVAHQVLRERVGGDAVGCGDLAIGDGANVRRVRVRPVTRSSWRGVRMRVAWRKGLTLR